MHGLHELPLLDVTAIRRDLHNAEVLEAHNEINAKYERLCTDSNVSVHSSYHLSLISSLAGVYICEHALHERGRTGG